MDILLTLIIAIIYMSLGESVMPLYLKRTAIASSPCNEMVVEKLKNNDLHNNYQSAYSRDYSTQTALLKVYSGNHDDDDCFFYDHFCDKVG